jgi:hypothetical protein
MCTLCVRANAKVAKGMEDSVYILSCHLPGGFEENNVNRSQFNQSSVRDWKQVPSERK